MRLILLFMFLSTLSVSTVSAAAERYTLVYSGNVDGELEPCGCTPEGDLGGLRRTATMLDHLRAEQRDLFTLSTGGFLSGFAANGRLTNEFILKGAAVMNYDAVAVQWSDLSFGLSLPTRYPLPWVASNWRGADFAKSRLITRGGKKLAFFTWMDPKAAPEQAMQGSRAQVEKDAGTLASALTEARKEKALTVVATTLSLQEAEQELPLDDIDVLLIRAKYEVYGEPQLRGATLILQPGSRGMRLGRIDLERNTEGKISAWHHEVIDLPSSIPDSPRLEAWYGHYTAKIKEAYAQMVAMRKAQEKGQTPFAGESVCRSCHSAAYEQWNKSRHARAFPSLEDVNKSFDPSCIQCHSVGFKQAGGFIDLELTPQLSNVQCESCHGAAREHALSAGAKRTRNAGMAAQQMCAQCHTEPHSPSFKFDKYWPRIAH